MKTAWLAGLLAGVLAGCASRALAGLPEDWDAPSAARKRESPVSIPAGPLTLEQAVSLAFERNPDLRAAAERIEAADARAAAASSAFYPELGARLSYARTDNPAQAFGMVVAQRRFSPLADVNDPGATQNWRPEIVASYALFRGFQGLHGLDAARTGVDLASLERAVLRDALGRAVTDTYLIHLASRQQAEAASASVEAVEAELADARKRLDVGALLKSDVLSLEVRLAAAKDVEVRARTGIEHARASLRALLALGSDTPVELSADLPAEDPSLPRDPAEAVARAAARRPELRAAAALVELRKSELAHERGGWWPRVDAFGSYGQDASDLDLSSEKDNWTFGFSVDLPLFSGFRTRAQVAGARARLEEARALEEKARLEVERDVRAALLRREEALERVRVTEKAVAAAEEALRLVREQYQAGGATVTRYLEAEVALADARARAIAGRTDVRRAEAELRRAVGGWK